MRLERRGRKPDIDKKIEGINTVLQTMLDDLDTKLDQIVSRRDGKFEAMDKTDIESLLKKIDEKIINDKDIQELLVTGDEATQRKIRELIANVEAEVRGTIEEYKDTSKGAILNEDQQKEVDSLFDKHVTKSDTVTRTKELDDFRATSITIDSVSDRRNDVLRKLIEVEEKLKKAQEFENLKQGTETLDQTSTRLITEATSIHLDANFIKRKNAILTGTYDYKNEVKAIAVDNYTYKKDANKKAVVDFLNELYKLKDGNPEIEKLFTDLTEKDSARKPLTGIVVDSKGKVSMLRLSDEQRKELRIRLNKKLKENPIDFDKAKENTKQFLDNKIADEMKKLIGSNFIKLYPNELKAWQTALANPTADRAKIFQEMIDFRNDTDFKNDIEDMRDNAKNKATLESDKTKLNERNDALYLRESGERVEGVTDTATQVTMKLNGRATSFVTTKDIMTLTNEERSNEIDEIYDNNKLMFAKHFRDHAPDSLKKVGFWQKIRYAITHLTLRPTERIIEENRRSYSEGLISDAMHRTAIETSKRIGARDEALAFGALEPEALRRVRANQDKIIEEHRKRQARDIVEKGVKATDAAKRAKEGVEAEKGLDEDPEK